MWIFVKRSAGLLRPPADTLLFLRAYLSSPRRIGALSPSGQALAGIITGEIDSAAAPVIELGPGTGVFTQALLARGVPEKKLALIESNTRLARVLRTRFPSVQIMCGSAARLRNLKMFDGESAGAIVSGLPLLGMPVRQVYAILRGAFWHMRTGGSFYQFTYGPVCPIRQRILHRLGLEAKQVGHTLANFPPATVYRIRRAEDQHPTAVRRQRCFGTTK